MGPLASIEYSLMDTRERLSSIAGDAEDEGVESDWSNERAIDGRGGHANGPHRGKQGRRNTASNCVQYVRLETYMLALRLPVGLS